MTQVPLAPPPPTKNPEQDRWLWLLWRRLGQTGQILWDTVSKAGSNLTDIETRNHNDLQNIQGGTTAEYYHFTQSQHTNLTDGEVTTLHKHTHNNQDGVQGGLQSGSFSDAFDPASFDQSALAEAYHISEADYDEIVRANNVVSVAADTALDDTYRTIIVTASGKTITLPAASSARVGRDWTIIQNVVGYVDVTRAGSDTLVLPETDTTVRIDNKGASVTFRCLSASSWGIA